MFHANADTGCFWGRVKGLLAAKPKSPGGVATPPCALWSLTPRPRPAPFVPGPALALSDEGE